MNPAKRILVVDDEEGFRSFFKDVLEDVGYAVDAAQDEEGALRLFAENAYDLVLMDGHLRGVYGMDVMSKMLADKPDTRVLILSVTHELYAQEAKAKGARACETKPTLPDTLEELVERYLS
jgi:CheY-like chemotaxis protein